MSSGLVYQQGLLAANLLKYESLASSFGENLGMYFDPMREVLFQENPQRLARLSTRKK